MEYNLYSGLRSDFFPQIDAFKLNLNTKMFVTPLPPNNDAKILLKFAPLARINKYQSTIFP